MLIDQNNNLIPHVVEKKGVREISYDIFSRLLKDRVIFLFDEVSNESASLLISQMLFLESQDSTKEISLYINSPGGTVVDGNGILDTMDYIKCPIKTICVGHAASFGANILANGTKGRRFATKRSKIMIHQPLAGGWNGQATDLQIKAENILKTRKELTEFLSQRTGQPYEKIWEDTERDNYMTAQEALDYGLIDGIIDTRN